MNNQWIKEGIKGKILKVSWDKKKKEAFAQQRKPLRKQKDNLLNGRKYLQITYVVRGQYPTYINSSYNSASENKQPNF